VNISRWANNRRSNRHILLEPDKPLTVAGKECELVGIQTHKGGLDYGHWETLARDHESNWWKFSGVDSKRVPLRDVSSEFAVNLVYRKLSG